MVGRVGDLVRRRKGASHTGRRPWRSSGQALFATGPGRKMPVDVADAHSGMVELDASRERAAIPSNQDSNRASDASFAVPRARLQALHMLLGRLHTGVKPVFVLRRA